MLPRKLSTYHLLVIVCIPLKNRIASHCNFEFGRMLWPFSDKQWFSNCGACVKRSRHLVVIYVHLNAQLPSAQCSNRYSAVRSSIQRLASQINHTKIPFVGKRRHWCAYTANETAVWVSCVASYESEPLDFPVRTCKCSDFIPRAKPPVRRRGIQVDATKDKSCHVILSLSIQCRYIISLNVLTCTLHAMAENELLHCCL